jgi:hypothetical protein
MISERRRREAEQSAQSAKNTGEKSEPKSKAMNIVSTSHLLFKQSTFHF